MRAPNAFSRQGLFNAVRGCLSNKHSPIDSTDNKRKMKCYKNFPLESHHIEPLGRDNSRNMATPQDFHSILCSRIRSAKRRVYLASLYIGPAVDTQKFPRETELLDSLRQAQKNQVDVKILLDLNRALRPVPIPNDQGQGTRQGIPEMAISSAEACRRALSDSDTFGDPKIFLISALTDFWQRVLPNPLNEVMGVFHIKAYIIDDTLIISGANLSEEYFVDRHDRYLSIRQGGNGLVDYYGELVEVLCNHAQVYSADGVGPVRSTAAAMLESVAEVVMTAKEVNDEEENRVINLDQEQTATVAVAVPTFQAPPHFGKSETLRYDVDAIHDLIRALSSSIKQDGGSISVLRLASAYLNPTKAFQAACEGLERVHMLTAGQMSHGFKPKRKPGNKGKDWIPLVFDAIAREMFARNLSVWFYERTDWTFHAKGLWVPSSPIDDIRSDKHSTYYVPFALCEDEDLVAATHGSGNFGFRSEIRDFESNLVLFFPPMSPLAESHKEEWNGMGDYATHCSTSDTKQLSFSLRLALPIIRLFF